MMNRKYNATNPAQGRYRRVLCVCSAGLLRSPTAALVLSQEPFNFNTRSAGIVDDYALTLVDPVLMEWADEAVVMMEEQKVELVDRGFVKPITVLGIEDSFEYRDPKLMRMVAERYHERNPRAHQIAAPGGGSEACDGCVTCRPEMKEKARR